LFLPVDEIRARLVGNEVLRGLSIFEPRIKVNGVEVSADTINQQYVITLVVSAITIDPTTGFRFVGLLSNSGFTFTN
jgi:phage baseplate assembly protein W